MKRVVTIPVLLLMLLFLLSCGDKVNDKAYVSSLASKVEHSIGNRIAGFSRVIVIPRRGCTGAIAEAMHYFRYGEDRENVLFVFTYNLDSVGIKNDIGDERLYNASNVFIDWENSFLIPSAPERVFPYEFIINKNCHLVDGRRWEIHID